MKSLKTITFISLAMASPIAATPLPSSDTTETIKVVYTTDVHGCFFPTDFTTLSPIEGSLARAMTAIDSLRTTPDGSDLILLDNGDILQGQPTAYYYNYIDTQSPHLASEILNFMGYHASTIGNHDIETGHPVYDRFRAQNIMPLLGANIIDTSTDKPYLTPYTIFERRGIKVAVLGLLTPAIPSWLPEVLWSGLRFEDMTESARKWIPTIQQKESPDIIIGLFHSGHNELQTTGNTIENASLKVAREVDGFDAILIGHDHIRLIDSVQSPTGKNVFVLNPANNARALGILDINLTKDADGHITHKTITPQLLDIRNIEPAPRFMTQFKPQYDAVNEFVSRRIGYNSETMSTEDAYFGPSSFMSLLHRLQLQISGADISFAAPLSFNATIKEGSICISDMFTLYKYENMLYVISMTGEEIKNYLEESYSLWTKQISDSQPHLINFESDSPTATNNRLSKPAYNFDSAVGIDYTVDITKPKGEKIHITQLSDGRPFSPDSTYSVALNSYRANGGGNLLTSGAGIAASELKQRILKATDKDLRYYLIKEIESKPEIDPDVIRNWRFIPEKLAEEAAAIDRQILFSPESLKEQK